MLVANGSFIIVIVPSALEIFVCTFGFGIFSACGAQNPFVGGGGAIALSPPVDPPLLDTLYIFEET